MRLRRSQPSVIYYKFVVIKASHFRRFVVLMAMLGLAFSFLPTANAANRYDSYRQRVVVIGPERFDLDVVAINLRNPKLVVQTLAATTKTNCYQQPCAVKALRSYVSNKKVMAAINGSYFCPKDYASCAGQAGSYYWMVYDARRKVFVNEQQNQFNNGGLFIAFRDRTVAFYPDTKPFTKEGIINTVDRNNLTAAISNGPTLINKKKFVLDETQLDTKQRTVKSNRSGLGIKGSTIYLIVARKATVIDLGYMMEALKMDFAMNLDGGGSSALWYRGSYKVGPGRNIPNALVVRTR
ncbi:MAG: phosphodiester glycosidase family protein [Candidatus Kerfeldbacteria bacterium]|nr:phosphodiester glycosidase family protein [Candidatus Kerfeldbacteria bacterium]